MTKVTRKYPKLDTSGGLKISLEVLKRLKRRKEIKEYEIAVGCFTNCREVGLTFCPLKKGKEYFEKKNIKTFCVYEHRNSDQIIINGKEGYICWNGELPYNSDSKYDYLGQAGYEEYDKATDILVALILKLNI